MKTTFLTAASAASLLSLLSPLTSAAPTSNTTVPKYSTLLADSFISRGVVPKTRSYTESTLYIGTEKLFNVSSTNATQTEYLNYIQTQIDAVINSTTGGIIGFKNDVYNLDDILIGRPLIFLYQQTGLEKYKKAFEFLRQRVNLQARTASGGFWHKNPAYPNQMWLDGLFMADTFYAQYTALFDAGNTTAWDDIVLQFDLIEQHTKNETTGLLYHGYDESFARDWADPVTGASPLVWDRAVGWYVMALLEVLDYFPAEHEGRAKLISYFASVAEGVKKSQDPESGGWWLIMDEEYAGAPGNYIESSATAMFTYGLLKGLRLGYIEKGQGFEETIDKAYELLTSEFVVKNGTDVNWEGTVVVGSLSGNASYEYYISQKIQQNDLKGAGPFIYASIEKEALA